MHFGLRRRLWRMRARWINHRSPPGATPLRISRRRLYILPTPSGGLFALLLVVMLLGATNYSNSLGFALTFWLGATALVSMHHAHRNLLGLEIRTVEAAPVFAGESARFEITLAHAAGRVRRAIRVSAENTTAAEHVDIDYRLPETVAIAVPASARGRLPCPRLRLESIYPIGLFRSWSWLTPRVHTLVYPRLAGREGLPEPAGGEDVAESRLVRGDDEFMGHRVYIPGDSPRRIDWKASARTDDLRVREYSDQTDHSLWLDYDHLGTLDREARLSQLALWIIRAERLNQPYGLRLPELCLGPDLGTSHRQACLNALALA